jgi:hypothetical protein
MTSVFNSDSLQTMTVNVRRRGGGSAGNTFRRRSEPPRVPWRPSSAGISGPRAEPLHSSPPRPVKGSAPWP